MVLRGESRRAVELADLSLVEYSKEEGPSRCFALVMLMHNGKVNQFGKQTFMGAIRHKDPMRCTMGSLAQYLFWRWHQSGEEPPDFRHRRDWYRTKMLVGADNSKEMSY